MSEIKVTQEDYKITVSVSGETVLLWNDESCVYCPEDLVWGREIERVFWAGVKAARLADKGKADPLYSAPTTSITQAELDALRKDAERYRWLRDGNDTKKSAACHIAVNCYGIEWDDAIDAAIAKENGE